ncbi:MAG: DUF1844 domain-containing protein [Candidatus Aminicenantes bacterium]|nr:MAG: DUF1844 domain-containing protein [Candidatus Aminicenantes bacterium]
MKKENKGKNKEKDKKKETKEEESAGREKIIPPLDFSSLVLPFYTQAIIKLGLARDPITNKEAEDLDLAKRLIDLLDLLRERTEGNLKPDEEKFLNACLQQLKMNYMEKANIIKI